MDKTIKTIRKTEPDLMVKSKPLSVAEKKKLSAIITESRKHMRKEEMFNL